jgi:hypothetical protein
MGPQVATGRPVSGQPDELHARLALAATQVGAVVEALEVTYRISLRAESDNETTRQAVADAVWELLGDRALSGNLEISLNNVSLHEELLEQALAPVIVYAV